MSQLQSVNAELNGALMRMSEERGVAVREAESLRAEVAELRGKVSEASKHCWSIAEELREARLSFNQEQNLRRHVEEQLAALVSQQNASDNVIKTLTGNLRRSELLSQSAEEDTLRKVQSLEAETEQLREILQSSTEEKDSLLRSLRLEEQERRREKSLVSSAIQELTEAVAGAKARNQELSQALVEARSHLVQVTDDNLRLEQRVRELEGARELEVAEHEEAIKSLQRELLAEAECKEDILRRVAGAATQIELLQSQLSQAQGHYLELLQRERETSAGLEAQVSALTQRNAELVQRVAACDAEVQGMRELMQREVAAASAMAGSLRDELEKRLEELLGLRKERDALIKEKESFLAVASERERTLQRKEEAFQKSLEADRARLQQELKSLQSRVKSLEADKADLLKENAEVTERLLLTQRDLAKASEDLGAAARQRDEAKRQSSDAQARLNDALEELKAATRQEQELREANATAERLFKEEVVRLESLVKESKRGASSQVAQISGHLKIASEELAALRKYNEELKESEKTSLVETEKLRTELVIRSRLLEDTENKLAAAASLSSAELKELQGKLQKLSETKSRLEVEMLGMTQRQTAMEREQEQWRERSAGVEAQLADERKASQQQSDRLERVVTAYNDLKLRFVETEELSLRQSRELEEMHDELARAEREGLAEARGLRVALTAANIELSDLKSLIDIQRGELEDARANLTKLQSSTASTISALSEELRAAEDRFGDYRRSSQEEINELHTRIRELNAEVERARESLDESLLRSKADKSVRKLSLIIQYNILLQDREMRAYAFENDLSRLKTALTCKEDRISELERQHQENRAQVLKLKETIAELEHRAQESEASFNVELQNKKRLEAKLKAIEAATVGESHNNQELLPPRRLVSSRSAGSVFKSTSALDGLERVSSPIRKATFDDFFAADSGFTEPLTGSQTMAGNALDLPTSLRTPERRTGRKASRGHVDEVRETVAASRQPEGASEGKSLPFEQRDEYELSIERTQQFLRQRLGAKGTSMSDGGKTATPKKAPRKDPAVKTTGASYLFKDSADSEVEGLANIQVPKLRPASPPTIK